MGSYYSFFENFLQQNYPYKLFEFIKISYCWFYAIKTPPYSSIHLLTYKICAQLLILSFRLIV